MAFDPDAYLAQKTAPQKVTSGGFDPDKYLAQKTGADPLSPGVAGIGVTDGPTPAAEDSTSDRIKKYLNEDHMVSNTVRGTIDQLPVLGATALGGLGAAGGTALFPGVGTAEGGLIGAGFGGAAGGSLKEALQNYLYGKKSSYKDLATAPVMGAKEGLEQEMGDKFLGKVGLRSGGKSGREKNIWNSREWGGNGCFSTHRRTS